MAEAQRHSWGLWQQCSFFGGGGGVVVKDAHVVYYRSKRASRHDMISLAISMNSIP